MEQVQLLWRGCCYASISDAQGDEADAPRPDENLA
jgi:hypothetical protein